METPFLFAVLLACGLLAAGLALRAGLWVLRVLYVPAAVVAGTLGFGLVQAGLRIPAVENATRALAGQLALWPTWLIAVVFAGLLLERPGAKSVGDALRRGARSAVLAWIIILGQIVIGLIVYLAAVRPGRPDVPASFGQLLEVSWAGGHGAAAAMGQVYAAQGFAEGKDLAFLLATVGLIYGVISGLALVNLAVRRGWTHVGEFGGRAPSVSGLEPARDPKPAAYARTRSDVIEPLVLQIVILAAAFGVGLGLQRAFVAGSAEVLEAIDPIAAELSIKFFRNVPLFLFTLLGGWIVRQTIGAMGLGPLIDPSSVQRLVGVAVDFLIVAAVATMKVESLSAFGLPIVLLVLLAGAWSAFCLLALAPRLLPRAYWFELGLLNYGFSTANTPQGLMLLRIVDPDLKSGAAEDYAVAATLSAPFIGGGVITIVALPLLLQAISAGWVIVGLVAAVTGLYALGRALGRQQPASSVLPASFVPGADE